MITVAALFVGIALGVWPGFQIGMGVAARQSRARYDRLCGALRPFITQGRQVAGMLEMIRSPAGPAFRQTLDNLESYMPEEDRPAKESA